MSIDAPFVAYKKREKPKPGQPGYKADPDKIQRDYEKWLERKKRRKVNMETFLGGKDKKTEQDNNTKK